MEGIGFKNMKLLKEEQWFDFRSITLLTGTNNSGKSSIINAMQMLQENISGNTMDDLLKTEFKVRANQNKYGSIKNFVNNDTNDEDSYFVFARRFKNFEYRFRVDINKGLESYGLIKTIHVFDISTNKLIFDLHVNSFQLEYLFNFTFNYKYFVDRFYEKCKKTEILIKRRKELDKLLKLVNKGSKSVEDLKALAEEISKEVSVYIIVYNIGDDPRDSNEAVTYEITNDDELILTELLTEYPEYKIKILEEVKVFFDETVVFDNEKYKKTFYNGFKFGLFDFTQLWETNPHIKKDFEEIICPYYKRDFEESCKLLCGDLLTVVSNTKWEMSGLSSAEEIWLTEFSILEEAFSALPDMGLIAKMLVYEKGKNGEKERNIIANDSIRAYGEVVFDSESMKHLLDANFFDEVYNKLSYLLCAVCKEDNDYVKRKKFLNTNVFNEISSDISQNLLNMNYKFNNVYVSSNRFTIRRSHSFDDSTDFVKLLKSVERLDSFNKKDSYTFINKWLNEFDLAEELILKSDPETSDFKAYLRNGDILTLLADYGLGTNQILPIIFALGIHQYYEGKYNERIAPRVVVIEEPEANLHPALQSKLADMFVEANKKFQVKIIVETHSEYLIRKLQYLVASPKSEVKPKDVVIYYFYKPNSLEVLEGRANQIEKIEIDQFGRLNKRFGDGFFDEADKIAINLFLLSKDQAN